MAVYTNIKEENLIHLLNTYNIGSLIKYEGILEGVENTNYKIKTSKNNYILTIFEKRVNESELPFFIALQKHLFEKNINCPEPIANKSNEFINKIVGKKCVIMSFLEGDKLDIVSPKHCYEVGYHLAKMHYSLKDFRMIRQNSLNHSQWKGIFDKCKLSKNLKDEHLIDIIERELFFLKEKWPNNIANIPKGIIHADLFKDNVFFDNYKCTGIIDFYFACVDFYIYDLAICINDWCFDKIDSEGKFDIHSTPKFNDEKYKSAIKGYQEIHKFTNDESKYFNIILRGASMRFLLTRLHDKLYHPKDSFVEPKNPLDYSYLLEFHQQNNLVLIDSNL